MSSERLVVRALAIVCNFVARGLFAQGLCPSWSWRPDAVTADGRHATRPEPVVKQFPAFPAQKPNPEKTHALVVPFLRSA